MPGIGTTIITRLSPNFLLVTAASSLLIAVLTNLMGNAIPILLSFSSILSPAHYADLAWAFSMNRKAQAARLRDQKIR